MQPSSDSTPPSMFGRASEFDTVIAHFDAVSKGRLEVVLISGEAGLGKTRLLDEIATEVAHRDGHVLRARGSHDAAPVPWTLLRTALGPVLLDPDVRDAARAFAPSIRNALSIVLPDRFERPADPPPASKLTHMRVIDGLRQVLSVASTTHPVLLALDDVHAADSASIETLARLSRRVDDLRVLIAATYQESAIAAHPALDAALAIWNQGRRAHTVRLRPLDASATSRVASATLNPPAPLDARLERDLFGMTGGNPLFAQAAIRLWASAGSITLERDRWVPAGNPLPAVDTVTGAFKVRMSTLPERTRDALAIVALTGMASPIEVVAGAMAVPVAEARDCVRPAHEDGLIEAEASSKIVVAHSAIRDAALAERTLDDLHLLHRAIATAIEATPAAHDPDAFGMLAFHHAEAGATARAAEFGMIATRHALATLGHCEARSLAEFVQGISNESDPFWGELSMLSGDASAACDLPEAAARAYGAAAEWFDDRGEAAATARARLREGQTLRALGRASEAHDAFETGLAAHGSAETITDLLTNLGSLLAISLGEPDDGRRIGEAALDRAFALADPARIALAERALGNALIRSCAFEDGIALVESALGAAEKANDHATMFACFEDLIVARVSSGNPLRAFHDARRELALVEQDADRYHQRHVYAWMAAGAAIAGQPSDADRLLARADGISAQFPDEEPIAYVDVTRAVIAIWYGDAERARSAINRVMSSIRAARPDAIAWYQPLLVMVHATAGDRVAAAAAAREAERLMPPAGQRSVLVPEIASALAIYALAFDEPVVARRAYEWLRPYQGMVANVLVDRLLGELALRLGDLRRAEQWLAAAERQAIRNAWLIEQAEVRAAAGELALAKDPEGGRTLASEAFSAAISLATQSNAPRVAERLVRRHDRLMARSQRPFNLSEREVKILQLVAAGGTNREIAETLEISEKTVANHLTAIFTKIGVTNRVGATAFALQHHLA